MLNNNKTHYMYIYILMLFSRKQKSMSLLTIINEHRNLIHQSSVFKKHEQVERAKACQMPKHSYLRCCATLNFKVCVIYDSGSLIPSTPFQRQALGLSPLSLPTPVYPPNSCSQRIGAKMAPWGYIKCGKSEVLRRMWLYHGYTQRILSFKQSIKYMLCLYS